ncbi:CASP-like protein 2C1 [Beta vulgaris subsp. vulgaris]|uniref:CASP-like protein 2C1 n=1 Tax=Beta vulgaris subsp. vulgaris TaxID=3555 RepID=UPI002036E9DF|nr:CASP-like protein 2C1 [Beta vulgaris subsp. vulgaris]
MELIPNNRLVRIEALLRFFALLTLSLASIVLVTDQQSRIYFSVYRKKVNYKLATILEVSLYVYSIGAGYNLLQLVRCMAFTNYQEDKLSWSNHILIWIYFLLDQMAVYVVFAICCASIELSLLALTGVEDLQWMKLCANYVRFCVQIGGYISCAGLASIAMIVISAISTFNLLRWYSPNFLCLKPKKIGIVSQSNNS